MKYCQNWVKNDFSTFAKKLTKKNNNNAIRNIICNSAQNGLIPQLDFFDKEIANNDNTSCYYIINNGDFVYNPRKSLNAPYGPVNIYKYDKAGIVSPLYLCFSVNGIDKKFLLHRFKSPCWHHYIYLNGDSGARHDRVSIRDDIFLSQPIFVPSKEEQTDIAVFLDKIDKRIEVQNKIISDLKILKKELCNKLFNSSLCDDEVEMRQIASVYGGYAFNSKTYASGKYKVVTIGNVTGDKYINGDYNSVDSLPYNIQEQQILNNGDILISLTGNVGRISLVNGDNYLLNQRVAKLNIEDDLMKEYVYQYLSNSSFEKDMNSAGQGAAQKNIKNEDILSYSIRIPTSQTSLEKIDRLLSTYDNLIKNKETILLNLKLQKIFLLNAMFI